MSNSLRGRAQGPFRPAQAQARAATPALFRKGDVVVVFSQVRSDLYYDLRELLGAPTY